MRALVLGTIIGIGGLSMTVAAFQAQKGAPPAAASIQVDKVKDNLFVLKGGGGNNAVFVTTNGVTVVDAKNPGWGAPILAKIKELTPKPVTTLINTHTHGDHVSGNVEFPATVEVIVQENAKAGMEKMDIFKQNNGRGLPKRTFKDKMTVGSGADQIDLYYFGPGHTDGDSWVVFPALRTAHLGDLFWQKALPLTDVENGGSVLHYAETLMKGYNAIKNVDTVINGHNATTTTWADVKEFAEFNQDFLTWAQAYLKSGKPAAQAEAEWKTPAKYAGYADGVAAMFGGMEAKLARLAAEMKTP